MFLNSKTGTLFQCLDKNNFQTFMVKQFIIAISHFLEQNLTPELFFQNGAVIKNCT
jgi:hypothetical protein